MRQAVWQIGCALGLLDRLVDDQLAHDPVGIVVCFPWLIIVTHIHLFRSDSCH